MYWFNHDCYYMIYDSLNSHSKSKSQSLLVATVSQGICVDTGLNKAFFELLMMLHFQVTKS